MKKQLSTTEVQDVLLKLEIYLSDLKVRWDQENPQKSWFHIPSNYLLKSTIFMISVIDELVLFVEDIIPDGADKKIAVLTLINRLYDYIVVQAFPIWLKPFSNTIKNIIVGVLISNLIDFMVKKYNSGYWSVQQEVAND